jgi:fibronectin type 3 domain-containing protein
MKTQKTLRAAAAVLCAFMAAACSDPLEGVMVKPLAPGAPALEAGVGTLTASWEAVDLADSYNLYYAESETRPETPSVSPIPETSYTINGLTNEKTYYVWVQAVNAAGASKISGMSEKTLTLDAPQAPVLTAGNGSIAVSWKAVDLADSYNLYYTDSGTRSESPQETGITGTSWTISGLTNEKTYYVWVQAVNAAGGSRISEMAEKTLTLTATAPVLRPGNGSIAASWEAVDLADSYNLYYADSGTRPETPAVSPISGISHTISGLTNGTTYYVWVQAVNSGGPSAVSAMAQITLSLAAPAKPALSPGDGSITVSWNAVLSADSYNLYYAESGTRPETPSVSPISGTSHSINGLTNGTTYYVWVQAVNSGGTSAVSPLSAAAPREMPPRPATGTELRAGQWTANTLSSSSQTDNYYIAVTSGQTYTVRWNDLYEGDGTKTAGVKVSAYWNDNNANIFTDANSGYITGKNFTASKDGWVMIRVGVRSSYTGSYAIIFTN